MKNRVKKRLIHGRHQLPKQFVRVTSHSLAEAKPGKLTPYTFIKELKGSLRKPLKPVGVEDMNFPGKKYPHRFKF